MTAYHVTPARNRLAIQRYGLIPRDTAAHHFGGDDPADLNWGIEAVYLHESLGAARDWLEHWQPADDSGHLILAVDVEGLPVEDDPYRATGSWYLREAIRVRDRIPPERISIAEAA